MERVEPIQPVLHCLRQVIIGGTGIGKEGLAKVSEMAVLNANYLRVKLQEAGFETAFDRVNMHEFVAQPPAGVKTLDVAKALLDYGMHPMTMYFPLVVKEAMMVEPTETESLETLDAFAATAPITIATAGSRLVTAYPKPSNGNTPEGSMFDLRPDGSATGPTGDLSYRDGRSGAPNDPFLVVGAVHAALFVASTAPDTDFVARLVDVHPDPVGYDAHAPAAWLAAVAGVGEVAESDQLFLDFTAGEVPLDPVQAAGAEHAPHRAPDLGADAGGVAALVLDQHALDGVAVGGAEEQLVGAVRGGQVLVHARLDGPRPWCRFSPPGCG